MSSLSSEELWVPKAGAAETSLSPLTACVQCSDLSLVPASLVPGSCDQWGCPLVQILGDPWQHCLAVAGVGAVQCRVPPVPGVPLGSRVQRSEAPAGGVCQGKAWWPGPTPQPSQGGGTWGAALVLPIVLQGTIWLSSAQGRTGLWGAGAQPCWGRDWHPW